MMSLAYREEKQGNGSLKRLFLERCVVAWGR